MEAISDLPMLNDIDADYSPQYVKLARILRDKIESGQYKHGDTLPAADLAQRARGIGAGGMARAGDARREQVRPPVRQVRPLHRDLAGGFVMRSRYRAGETHTSQGAVVGANIRVLCQRNGWTQTKLGELMGPGHSSYLVGHRLSVAF